MEPSRDAPVFETGQVQVAASPEAVWEVLADIGAWPSWQPDIKTVSLQNEVAEGAVFRWKSGPGTITSTLRRVQRPWVLGWSGTGFGIKAVHVWHLQSHDGGTLVRTEESFTGLLATAFRASFRRRLRQALDSWLHALKVEAERRSRP